MRLNAQILNLVVMVQSYNKAISDQNMFYNLMGKQELIKDSYKLTQKFYNAIGDEMLKTMGLSTNNISFEKVMGYRVTKEMTNTLYDDLEKFEF